MAERPVSTLLDGGSFFESPRWQAGRWWVSDFYRRLVLTVDAAGRAEEVMSVEQQPSGIGWMPDGSMLVVSMLDRSLLRRHADGQVDVHADLSELAPGPCNDMVVDHEGRAYVANFGSEFTGDGVIRETVLIRVDPDGTASVAADGLRFPNGSVITPDGLTLIVGETFGGRYTAFTVASDGSLSERRVWAQLGPSPDLGPRSEMVKVLEFTPDGCTLDREGHLWSADPDRGRCCRIAPGGDIVEEVRVRDGLRVFACMLGGDDGRTLLICAAPDFSSHRRAKTREAVLLTTQVDVPHAGLP